MRYLIDTVCFKEIITRRKKGLTPPGSLFITRVIQEELGDHANDIELTKHDIKILKEDIFVLSQIKKVMKKEGDNEKFIRLYNNKGAGDVNLIATVLAIRQKESGSGILFEYEDDLVIVTHDKGLQSVCKKYDIPYREHI